MGGMFLGKKWQNQLQEDEKHRLVVDGHRHSGHRYGRDLGGTADTDRGDNAPGREASGGHGSPTHGLAP